jgi:release factor glutamine methyltransferase
MSFVRDRRSDEAVVIVDVGTGCGAIAVCLAHLLPSAQLIAVDTSADALALAHRNADRHVSAQPIIFLQGSLLEPIEGPVDLILANLPYIPTAVWAGSPLEIRDHEPRRGLDGGPDGLRAIACLIEAAPEHLVDGGSLVLEIGDEHATATTTLARDAFPDAKVTVQKDLAGLDRMLVVHT